MLLVLPTGNQRLLADAGVVCVLASLACVDVCSMDVLRDDDTHIRALVEELKCPICKEFLTEPYVTPCGHTFCHRCIARHLETRQTCPCCSAFTDESRIHPIFAMEKVCMTLCI